MEVSLSLVLVVAGALVLGVVSGVVLMWLVHQRLLASEVARASSDATARASVELAPLRESLVRHEAEASLTLRHGNVAELLAPIRETLARYDDVLGQMGRAQARTAGAIGERLDAVALAGESLRRETQQLSQALRAPTVRGQWGELQLRRVCELAGMLAYCDFEPQVTVRNDDGVQRPDVVVRLPGNRRIVIDAKAPLTAYLEATGAIDDRTRTARLVEHAAHVRTHVQRLSAKKYWAQFDDAPDFVVLFLPGEAFFAAALEADPSLLEVAMSERVLLATPTTLIALLKATAFGWRQERATADAGRIVALARELQERLVAFDEQLGDVGKGLQRAVTAYNRAIGGLESRVLVSARKLGELGVDGGALKTPVLVQTVVREDVV